MSRLLHDFGAFAGNLAGRALPPEVWHHTKRAVIDWTGCAVAGGVTVGTAATGPAIRPEASIALPAPGSPSITRMVPEGETTTVFGEEARVMENAAAGEVRPGLAGAGVPAPVSAPAVATT